MTGALDGLSARARGRAIRLERRSDRQWILAGDAHLEGLGLTLHAGHAVTPRLCGWTVTLLGTAIPLPHDAPVAARPDD